MVDKATSLLKAKSTSSFIFGNGGSAGIASHIAVDLTKAANIPCLTFTDPALVTCFANDFGYDRYVEECINRFCVADDVVILISSSGSSKNVLNAVDACKTKKVKTITLSGFHADNPLTQKFADVHYHVESDNYNVIESCHFLFLISVIEKLRLSS